MTQAGSSKPPGLLLLTAVILALGCASRMPEAPLTAAKDRSPQVQAILVQSAAAYQRGNLLLTQQLLMQARAAAPDDPDIALDLGDTLNRLQRMESARQLYAEFLSHHPSAAQIRLALGLTLMGLGRWEESADQIKRVSEGNPTDPYARFNLGLILSRLGRYSQAVPELRRAAELSPSDPEVFTELGIALMRTGDPAEAEKALRQALALDPDHVAALFQLGQCYERLGRHADSQAALERFFRASGSREKFLDEKRLFRAAQARADALARAGKDELALQALLAYRESLTDFPPFQQELGIAYLRAGHREEAIAAFERAVQQDPTLTEAHAQLAVLYQQSGQSDKAMKARQSAARRHAQGPQPAETP